jgi:Tfp pilus assembly protein PilV
MELDRETNADTECGKGQLLSSLIARRNSMRNREGTNDRIRVFRRTGESERGFLTIELLVSSTILLFILVSMMPLFVYTLRESAASKDMTVAWAYAMDKMEELDNLDYSALPSGANSDIVSIGKVKFTRTWTVIANAPQVGMKTVTVEVFTAATRSFGKPRRASLSVYRIPEYPD